MNESDSYFDPNLLAEKIIEEQANHRKALQVLLDQEATVKDQIIVQKTRMGESEGFVASVSLSWLAANVGFASNLPMFEAHANSANKQITIDSDTIDEIRQRKLRWSRQFPMAQYLLSKPQHIFPPILAVMSQSWVDDEGSDNWLHNGIALESSREYRTLDSEGHLGILTINEESQLFALDGQHRLLAVLGALEFVETGTLTEWDDDHLKIRETLTRDIFRDRYPNITETHLQSLKTERIGLQIITAVQKGESKAASRQRIRSIFVHVNKMASGLGASEIATLDEDDGFKILGRMLAKHHLMFQPIEVGTKTVARVNFERAALTSKNEHLTTIETIGHACKRYLTHYQAPFSHWLSGSKGLVPSRPTDEDLQEGWEKVEAFFDRLWQLPTMTKVAQGVSPKSLRDFGSDQSKGNLLVRPYGQILVAEVVGRVHCNSNIPLDTIFEKLTNFDSMGGFGGINLRESIWWGVAVSSSISPTMKKDVSSLSINLLSYLLGDQLGDLNVLEELRRGLKQARTLDENLYVALDGNTTPNSTVFQLPPVL